MTKTFQRVSKKIDILEDEYFCAYSIRCYPDPNYKSSIKYIIEKNNIINNTLIMFDRLYHSKAYEYGDGILIDCVDLDMPFNRRSIDYKGNKGKVLSMSKSSLWDRIVSKLETHNKIFTVISGSGYIEIEVKKITLDKAREILTKMFPTEIENKLIKVGTNTTGVWDGWGTDKIYIKIL
jgi:hypothetical protein